MGHDHLRIQTMPKPEQGITLFVFVEYRLRVDTYRIRIPGSTGWITEASRGDLVRSSSQHPVDRCPAADEP